MCLFLQLLWAAPAFRWVHPLGSWVQLFFSFFFFRSASAFTVNVTIWKRNSEALNVFLLFQSSLTRYEAYKATFSHRGAVDRMQTLGEFEKKKNDCVRAWCVYNCISPLVYLKDNNLSHKQRTQHSLTMTAYQWYIVISNVKHMLPCCHLTKFSFWPHHQYLLRKWKSRRSTLKFWTCWVMLTFVVHLCLCQS